MLHHASGPCTPQEDLRVFNLFLFKFTLPMSVILGLGLKTDLYTADIWRFIGAFLVRLSPIASPPRCLRVSPAWGCHHMIRPTHPPTHTHHLPTR